MKTHNIFAIALIISILLTPEFAVADIPIAIGVKENINLPNSSVYSNNGGLAAIRTNSTAPGAITFGTGHTINADVIVGPGGNPGVVINNPGSTITGNIYPADELIDFIQVAVPDYLATLPNGGLIQDPMTISASGRYQGIDLGNNEFLTINGDVYLYVTGSIQLGNSSQIRINPNSSLTLYLNGNLDGRTSSGFINMTQDWTNLGIYALSTVTNIIVKNSENLYGTIYAPNADVVVDNGADVYGGIAANSFLMKNAGIFYYDSPIPEPATFLLLALGGLLFRRKIENHNANFLSD